MQNSKMEKSLKIAKLKHQKKNQKYRPSNIWWLMFKIKNL